MTVYVLVIVGMLGAYWVGYLVCMWKQSSRLGEAFGEGVRFGAKLERLRKDSPK